MRSKAVGFGSGGTSGGEWDGGGVVGAVKGGVLLLLPVLGPGDASA